MDSKTYLLSLAFSPMNGAEGTVTNNQGLPLVIPENPVRQSTRRLWVGPKPRKCVTVLDPGGFRPQNAQKVTLESGPIDVATTARGRP